MMNPTLADLIGGIQSVTLSDEEARRRGTQKSILERKAPPTFDTIIEIIDRDQVAVHNDVASTVDLILRGGVPRPELRRREEDGEVAITAAVRVDTAAPRENGRVPGRGVPRDSSVYNGYALVENGIGPESQASAPAAPAPLPAAFKRRGTDARPLRIYAFGVSRNRLEHAIETLHVPAAVVRDAREADIVLTLRITSGSERSQFATRKIAAFRFTCFDQTPACRWSSSCRRCFPSRKRRGEPVRAGLDPSRSRSSALHARARRSTPGRDLRGRGRNLIGDRRGTTSAACPAGIPHSAGAASTG